MDDSVLCRYPLSVRRTPHSKSQLASATFASLALSVTDGSANPAERASIAAATTGFVVAAGAGPSWAGGGPIGERETKHGDKPDDILGGWAGLLSHSGGMEGGRVSTSSNAQGPGVKPMDPERGRDAPVSTFGWDPR